VCIEKKRKDYAFWHHFDEKPSIKPSCPGACAYAICLPEKPWCLKVCSLTDKA